MPNRYSVSEKRIYVTTDYSLFKHLTGNRSVEAVRALQIMDSIQDIGWITEPILVNEKFEVIDGQGRLTVLQELEMPVEFIIEEEIGTKECQRLNRGQKNWSTKDYINSYIAIGNDNYIWLKSMLDQYKGLPTSVILSIAATKGESSTIGASDSFKLIESGDLRLNTAERRNVNNALFYLSRFIEVIKHLGGRKDKFFSAVMFLYLLDCVDNERFYTVVKGALYDGMIAASTREGYLQQFEDIYNKKLTKRNRVDIIHEYKIS